jgi:RNA polymerase sigma-70 factor, ECF subfamily
MRHPDGPAPEDPTLRILMAEYQAGSVEAFDRLHDALAPDLKAHLTALARDSTCADDLLQETFLQIHRSRAVHTPGEPVRPWCLPSRGGCS